MRTITPYLNFIFLLLIISIAPSCTIQKRLYSKGYYVDRNDHHFVAKELKRETDASLAESTVIGNKKEIELEIGDREQGSLEIPEQKISSDQRDPELKPEIEPKRNKLLDKIERFKYVSPIEINTPADRDASKAMIFLVLTLLLGWLSVLIAIHFAKKSIRENGKDGYPFSNDASAKAHFILDALEILAVLLLIVTVTLIFYFI